MRGGDEHAPVGRDLQIDHHDLRKAGAGHGPGRRPAAQDQRPEIGRGIEVTAEVIPRDRVDGQISEVVVQQGVRRAAAMARAKTTAPFDP